MLKPRLAAATGRANTHQWDFLHVIKFCIAAHTILQKAGPRVIFLTAYRFRYMLDILFRSDSPRPSATGLQSDRVRCVNLAQKISSRTDCPILVRKLFTNMFYTPILFLDKGV